MRFAPAVVLLMVASGLPIAEVRGQPARSLDQRFQELLDESRAFEVGNDDPSRPFHRFAPRFLELAVSSPTDPAGRKSLLWIVQAGFPLLDSFRYGESEPSLRVMGQALELLGKSHSQDEEVGFAGRRGRDGLPPAVSTSLAGSREVCQDAREPVRQPSGEGVCLLLAGEASCGQGWDCQEHPASSREPGQDGSARRNALGNGIRR